MSEYYHIDWKFTDNTVLDIDLLNIIMSYGDVSIHEKYTIVLNQLLYLSKEYDYLRNVARPRLCNHRRFFKFCLARTREKKRLMKKNKPRPHQELADSESDPVTPPPSPVSSLSKAKDYRDVSDSSTSSRYECDPTH